MLALWGCTTGYIYCTHFAYKALCKSKGVLVAITSVSGPFGGWLSLCHALFARRDWPSVPHRILCQQVRRDGLPGGAEVGNERPAKCWEIGGAYPPRCQRAHCRDGTALQDWFDIVVVCPPSVDTELRKHAITNSPNVSRDALGPLADARAAAHRGRLSVRHQRWAVRRRHHGRS